MNPRPPSPAADGIVAAAAACAALWLVLAVFGWPRLSAACGVIALLLTLVGVAHLFRLQDPRR